MEVEFETVTKKRHQLLCNYPCLPDTSMYTWTLCAKRHHW